MWSAGVLAGRTPGHWRQRRPRWIQDDGLLESSTPCRQRPCVAGAAKELRFGLARPRNRMHSDCYAMRLAFMRRCGDSGEERAQRQTGRERSKGKFQCQASPSESSPSVRLEAIAGRSSLPVETQAVEPIASAVSIVGVQGHQRGRDMPSVWLSPAARRILDGLPRSGPWVFPACRGGGHLSMDVLHTFWCKVRADASIEDVRCHGLRHLPAMPSCGAFRCRRWRSFSVIGRFQSRSARRLPCPSGHG